MTDSGLPPHLIVTEAEGVVRQPGAAGELGLGAVLRNSNTCYLLSEMLRKPSSFFLSPFSFIFGFRS